MTESSNRLPDWKYCMTRLCSYEVVSYVKQRKGFAHKHCRLLESILFLFKQEEMLRGYRKMKDKHPHIYINTQKCIKQTTQFLRLCEIYIISSSGNYAKRLCILYNQCF